MGKADPKTNEALKKEEKRARKAAKKEAKKAKKDAKKQAKKKTANKLLEHVSQSENSATRNPRYLEDMSFLRLKRVEVTVSLLPSALGNVPASIDKYIELMLFKYCPRVGILLLYENVKISETTGGHGRILDELPNVHYRVQFDGLVFCPTTGCKLNGVVRESFPSHISVLVFDYFNAMIPAESLQAMGYTFDSDSDSWSKGCGDDGRLKSKGPRTVISFTVNKIHECVGTVSLEGSNPECCGEVTEHLIETPKHGESKASNDIESQGATRDVQQP